MKPFTAADPLHMESGPDTPWTMTNVAEAMPGVQTVLGWTFWRDACERAVRENFRRLGALRRGELAVPESPDDRFSAVFYGRAAGNVRLFREMGDRLPGTSGDAVEEQLFGVKRSATASSPRWERYPVVAAKMPVAAVRSARRIKALRAETDRWWRSTVEAPPATLAAASALLREASRRFEEIMGWHCLVTMLGQGLYEQVTKLAVGAGLTDQALDLVSGYGATEEVCILEDLWALSQGQLTEAVFLARHGYHGPGEGELSGRTWREDPSPLRSLIAAYADLSADRRPAAIEASRQARRREAEAKLMAALPASRWAVARLLLAASGRYLPLREVGKAAFLQTIDAARLAARVAGRLLAADGVITDPEDVFHITLDELSADGVPPAAVINERRGARERYLAIELPGAWVGTPIVTDAAEVQPPIPGHEGEGDGRITGIGASSGLAEGVARVVTDPVVSDDFEVGDVLVCHTTDPGWASIMFLAGALVVDVGGPMSHAAIVARELGVPCVVNTGDGTRRVRSGERLRVDGTAGLVERVGG